MLASNIEIIKQTVPVIQERGEEITQHFYHLLFEENPELKDVFNMASQSNGRQPASLANAILGYAANIDRLAALGDAVNNIATKHFSLDIQPEQYPIVGRNLLKAIREVLGAEVASDDVINAWAEAYGQLANILIGAEKALYENMKNTAGGWSGFKPFRVVNKVQQSSEITSFYLKPVDGQPLPSYKPGQYLSLKINDASLANTELRQYSLSDSHNSDSYRISVKREPAPQHDIPAGVASNFLHDNVKVDDTILVHAPAGNFYLDDSDKPVVLISGGVGVTPMLSMLNDLVRQHSPRKITWFHGTRNRQTHAFREHINALDNDLANLTKVVFYDDVAGATQDTDYNHEGYMTAQLIKENCPLDAEFYFCGPLPFMQAIHTLLRQLGVADEQLHYEIFGPSEALN
ncbi:NO-inducible flavohemoprotein [Neptunomonas qingdaonensis]|uniref:Flavohemoprotein n=1 Tax=Neptunomonas qingdaonensis TaxID=1045558 RepID=A0A1I2UKR5_9GAMM|nr:NO-inducible flavohemoprotein [Neptunomonas qingdaonensis]SFG77762.1 nitric oxide dioxygenase [Neptunomonas qingdaonensis]